LGANALRNGQHLGADAGEKLIACFKQALALDDDFIQKLPHHTAMLEALELTCLSVFNGEDTERFAARLGCAQGVSGFVMHTVPVALHAWMTHPQALHHALHAVIRCGGDTDTCAAITGAVVGAAVGEADIPQEGLTGLCEWPRSVTWQRELASRVARAWPAPASERPPEKLGPLGLSLWGLMMRNGLFFWLVLLLGFRRLLPPY
jgi:ADP-ribosylglycohydrolase